MGGDSYKYEIAVNDTYTPRNKLKKKYLADKRRKRLSRSHRKVVADESEEEKEAEKVAKRALTYEERVAEVQAAVERKRQDRRESKRNQTREFKKMIALKRSTLDMDQLRNLTMSARRGEGLMRKTEATKRQRKLTKNNMLLNVTIDHLNSYTAMQLFHWLRAMGYNQKMPHQKKKYGAGVYKTPSLTIMVANAIRFVFFQKKRILKHREEKAWRLKETRTWWKNGTIYNPSQWRPAEDRRWERSKKLRDSLQELTLGPDCSRHSTFNGDYAMYHPDPDKFRADRREKIRLRKAKAREEANPNQELSARSDRNRDRNRDRGKKKAKKNNDVASF